MKHYALRLIVSLLTFAIGLATASVFHVFRPANVAHSRAEREIMQVEHEYIRANLERDTDTLDNILADEFTISSRYRMTDKAQRLALLRNPDFAFESINVSDEEVTINGDSAEVTGTAWVRGHYYERVFTSPTYEFTRNYERRDGHWQIVSVRVWR